MKRLLLLAGLSLVALGAAAQVREPDLVATAQLFAEPAAAGAAASPAGVVSFKAYGAGPTRRYYVLRGAREGSLVAVFDADGRRVAQAPALGAATTGQKDAALNYAVDFDVDADGRIIVADRGAHAVKVYDAGGVLLHALPLPTPISVLALPGGEIAVTNLRSEKLINVFALRPSVTGGPATWSLVREFGMPVEITDGETARELNRAVNLGRLTRDAAANLYYVFTYLPEPTVRKYDRFGYLALEIALTSPEFQPAAQSLRGAIERLRQRRFTLGGQTGPPLRQSVEGGGVDPESQELWVALGTQLLHFDRDGNRRGSYRTYTAEGQRVEASSIVVEPTRLLLSSATLGVFEFPRPDKPRPPARPAN
jgi:hypothetical protein